MRPGNRWLQRPRRAAISGPDQLRAAKAAQDALRAWMAEQRQKLADQQKDAQAKLAGVERDRQSLAAQVASLNKQLADAKKPNAGDQATIAELNRRIVEIQHDADSEYKGCADEISSLNRQLADVQSQCSTWGWLDQSRHGNPPLPSDLPHSHFKAI